MTNSDEILFDVIEALAEADGTSPQGLEYSLGEYVDPYLLQTIVSDDMKGELTFQVPGHEVTVTTSGEIGIDGVEAPCRDHQYQTDPDVRGLSGLSRQVDTFFDNFPCTVYQSRNEPGWPIEFISKHCLELTGYDPNAFVVGGVNFGFDLIHPDDRERVSKTVRQAVENEEPFSMTYRIKTADGSEKWVQEIGVGLYDEAEPISFVGTLIDRSSLRNDPKTPTEIEI